MPPAPNVDKMHTLKVDNLSSRTTESELKDTFGRFGEIGGCSAPCRPGLT